MPRDRKLVDDAILVALASRAQIRIWYRDIPGSPPDTTKLSLYRLVLAREIWFAVGGSTLRRKVRVFSIPRIERFTPTTDP